MRAVTKLGAEIETETLAPTPMLTVGKVIRSVTGGSDEIPKSPIEPFVGMPSVDSMLGIRPVSKLADGIESGTVVGIESDKSSVDSKLGRGRVSKLGVGTESGNVVGMESVKTGEFAVVRGSDNPNESDDPVGPSVVMSSKTTDVVGNTFVMMDRALEIENVGSPVATLVLRRPAPLEPARTVRLLRRTSVATPGCDVEPLWL